MGRSIELHHQLHITTFDNASAFLWEDEIKPEAAPQCIVHPLYPFLPQATSKPLATLSLSTTLTYQQQSLKYRLYQPPATLHNVAST
jgi:hypothetical protein